MVKPLWCCKGHLLPHTGGQRHLLVPSGEVQGADEPGQSQPFDELVHSGHRVGVTEGDFVELPEIVAEAPAPIGFLDQHNGAGPGAVGLLYDA